jgi:hypothetical protein
VKFAVNEISVGEIALSEIALGKIALGEIALGEISYIVVLVALFRDPFFPLGANFDPSG